MKVPILGMAQGATPMTRRMPPPPEAQPSAEQAFERAYAARFAEYHLAWSVFFVGHMADLRTHFDDLEDALLLAAFGLGPLAEKLRRSRREGDAEGLIYGKRPASEGWTNARRLAEVTGIPRETVRRKLERFRRRGWVEQTDDRSWRMALLPDGSAPLAADMKAANAEFVARLARLMAEFKRIEGAGPG
jgi:DNA-binding MarR family transcriptional regulator